MNFRNPSTNRAASLAEAKDRLRIADLWRVLRLPGEPPARGVGSCRSPFRGERHPSFSVFAEGRAFCDHATGEKGDAIEFLHLATGLEGAALYNHFRALAGVSAGAAVPTVIRSRNTASPPPPESEKRPNLRGMRLPTRPELEIIANLRHLSPEGLGLAAKVGFLRIGGVKGHLCFILTEPDGRTAAARRLDGEPFLHADGHIYKSHALTCKRWPLGLGALPPSPDGAAVLLCEGEPDFLAALHFKAQWGEPNVFPVALLGRTQDLHPEAVARLAGWRIRAFPHADPDGKGFEAVRQWAAQIPGALADAFDFRGLRRADGSPVNDLNDCTRIHSDDAAILEALNPLPLRHPCNDLARLDFDHANRFRVLFWGRIDSVTVEGWPVVSGAACPF